MSEQKPKDELIYLFLQFQRSLILKAINLVQNKDLRFDSHILDMKDPKQIETYCEYLKTLQKNPLIRIATKIHEFFDYAKKLKAPLITFVLYLRYFKRMLSPETRYGDYQAWLAKKDSPTDLEISQWAQIARPVTILCLNLDNPREIILSLKKLKEFQTKWFFYGSQSDIDYLKESLNDAGVLGANHYLIVEKSFHKDLAELVSQMDDLIIVQDESGQLSSRSLKELSAWGGSFGYGDSDSIDPNGKRSNPKFHPEFNLRYFVGQNVFAGLTLLKKAKLSEALKAKILNAWPDLLVHLITQTPEDDISHIPKILFHTQDQEHEDEIPILAELSQHLEVTQKAYIDHNSKKVASIIWPLPQTLPKVSILIPTRDQCHLLKKLIDGILNHTDYPDVEIVIVDNESKHASTKAFFAKIQNDPSIKIIPYSHPFNFSAINNFGFKHCTGEILVLLNNDIEVMQVDWLRQAVREALAPQVGIVGAKLYYKNGFIQHAGVVLSPQQAGHIHLFERAGSMGYCNRLQFPHELSAVTAACMIMRSEVFQRVQGFNEKDLAVAYNDVDLCLRVRELGLKVVWTPKVELYHIESASRPPDTRYEQVARYRREVEYMRTRWSEVMQRDPFYSPNLSLTSFGFELNLD